MIQTKFIPGVHPTYKEQFDKITRAYFKDEIISTVPCACFVGNLLNNTEDWFSARYLGSHGYQKAKISVKNQSNGLYTVEQVLFLETNFMDVSGQETEEEVFEAINSTLDMLRKIHEDAGEIIDRVPTFTKRQLQAI